MMDEDSVMRRVDFGLAERITLADELSKIMSLCNQLDEVFKDDWDAKRISVIWEQFEFPIKYITSVFGARFHEAVHKVAREEGGNGWSTFGG